MTASPHLARTPLRSADAPRPAPRGVPARARQARIDVPRIRGWASTERIPAGDAARTSEHVADLRMAGGAPPARAG